MSIDEELERLREYFEDRQDASMEPGEDRFHGNKEMSLLQDVETIASCFSQASLEREALSLILRNEYRGQELVAEAVSCVMTKYDDGFTPDRATQLIAELKAVLPEFPKRLPEAPK